MRSDAGPLLDPAAKAAYRRRLVELAIEADEADAAKTWAARSVWPPNGTFWWPSWPPRWALEAGTESLPRLLSGLARASPRVSGTASPASATFIRSWAGTLPRPRTRRYCAYRPDERLAIAWEP